jgi:hypothetical protein
MLGLKVNNKRVETTYLPLQYIYEWVIFIVLERSSTAVAMYLLKSKCNEH